MLGKTYCWVTKEKPYRIVALITLANDSIKAHKLSSSTRNKVQRNISNAKAWFCHKDNKTGCRFIVVDAYNKQRVLSYYANNGFKFLFKTEEDEKLYYEVDANSDIHTRLMYFDLKSKK